MNAHDDDHDDHDTPITATSPTSTPSSPPPSFRSRASSPTFRRLLSHDDPLHNEEEDQTLADTFDDGEASDAEDGLDDRQRLMRADPEAAAREAEHQRQEQQASLTANTTNTQRAPMQRRATELPSFTTSIPRQQPRGNNDGVFANLAAKPERGDSGDEKPPVSPFSPLGISLPYINPITYTSPPSRPTKPPPPTPPRRTGKPPSPSPAPASRAPTKSTSTASPSAPSSPSPGTP